MNPTHVRGLPTNVFLQQAEVFGAVVISVVVAVVQLLLYWARTTVRPHSRTLDHATTRPTTTQTEAMSRMCVQHR